MHDFVAYLEIYCIAGNFRQEKSLPILPSDLVGKNFVPPLLYWQKFIPSNISAAW